MSELAASDLLEPRGRSLLAGLAALALSLFVTAEPAPATPRQNPTPEPACISLYGRSFSPTEIYDRRHACGTCGGQRDHPALCGTLNQTMVPNWTATSDLVAVPHRGLWGQPLSQGAPENTREALQLASANGYRVIEIDVALTGPDTNGARHVFLGHYFTLAASNGNRGADPSTLRPDTVYAQHMNYRDQTSSTGLDHTLLSFQAAVVFAKRNDVILMIDPKVPQDAPPETMSQIMAYVLNEAETRDALKNIVLKTAQDYKYTIDTMTPFLSKRYSDFAGQFLWSPITAGGPNSNLTDILHFVQAWDAATRNSRQILVYETNLFSPNDPAAQPFPNGGRTYDNLIDFVRLLSPVTKRSALWSIDPAGNKGTLGRLYNWKFVGNTDTDQRGDPLVTLSHRGANHAMITTDRPEQFSALVGQ